MKKNPGQITLIVLLVMLVLLTTGLSVVSRSITDIRISKETEEAARAFSAAEAGIEEALKYDLATWTPPPGGIEVGGLEAQVTVTKTNSFETRIEANETAEVNLTDYSGNIEISWSGEGGLELVLIYPQTGTYKASRWALKPTGSSCGQNFEELSPTKKTISVPAGAGKKALRLRPICVEADIKVTGSNPLPDQSYRIRSEVTGPGGETRVLVVTKSLPILPPIFDYALFSGGGLSK